MNANSDGSLIAFDVWHDYAAALNGATAALAGAARSIIETLASHVPIDPEPALLWASTVVACFSAAD
jgi:hypothetical protein